MFLEFYVIIHIYIYKYSHKKSAMYNVIRASHVLILKIQEQNLLRSQGIVKF